MGQKKYWPEIVKGYAAAGCIPLFMCTLLLLTGQAEARSNPYLDDLLEKVEETRVYEAPYWHVLLHYKQGLFGTKSLIDDGRFFLSPAGRGDPRAELEATIEGFFRDDVSGDDHPQCRFPARFAWLKEELSMDTERLPKVFCGELTQNLLRMNPKKAVLVFASAHLNSPASMFGHTLVRIDSSYESPLLSYAVNYAASIDPDDSGVVYAFKGIFGFYPGFYSILPYYDKVKEYNNMDQRDLWEYELNLNDAEVRRMALHIWELKDIYSDYFFFDENCSYNLLFLLEAARPTVSVTDKRGFWVTPADTLFWVLEERLSEEVVFRPSQARKIRHIAASMKPENKRLARLLVVGEVMPEDVITEDLSVEEKIGVLEIASEYTQLRYMKNELSKEEFQNRYLKVLTARSKLKSREKDPSPVPVPARPEEGHATSRGGAGAGVRGDDLFLEFTYRPVYHDLLDPDEGYKEGSQIDFSALFFRYYPERDNFRLERWDIINIISLAERDQFFRPVSWKVILGMTRKDFPEGEQRPVFSLNPAGGFTWNTDLVGLSYVFFETELDISGRYPDGFAAGFGPSLGVLREVTRAWKFQLQGRYMYFPTRDDHKEFSADLLQSFQVSRNNSIFFEIERSLSSWGHHTDFTLTWNHYF